jgi:hypothetical protein
VDMYRKVRLACAEGMSQREAARHFNISRDSVRKMLAFSVPPGYRRTAPVKRPKLDGFTGIIDGWLEGIAGPASSGTRPSGCSSGFATSTASPAATRS